MVHFISDIQDHIRKIQKVGAVSFPLLENNERVALLEEAKMQMYSKEEYPGIHGVHQQMSVFDINSEQAPKLHAMVNSFEEELSKAFQSMSDLFLLERPLCFTERRVQFYEQGSIGITPHQDGSQFRNVIVLIMLAGKGKLYLCDDRSRANARMVKTDPGYCVLMRAPGFMCEDIQPMHFVRDISVDRYLIAIRQRVPKAERAQ